jgi:hypothetical protein
MKHATKLSCNLFLISQKRKLIKCDIKIVEQLVTPGSLGQTHATPKNIFFGNTHSFLYAEVEEIQRLLIEIRQMKNSGDLKNVIFKMIKIPNNRCA